MRQLTIPIIDTGEPTEKEIKQLLRKKYAHIKFGEKKPTRTNEYEARENGMFIKRPEIGSKIKIYISCNGNDHTYGIVMSVIIEDDYEKVLVKPCDIVPFDKVDYFLPETRVKFPKNIPYIIHVKKPTIL